MNLLLLTLGTHQIKWQIQTPPSWLRLPIVVWGEFSLFMWVQHPHQIFGNSCLLTAWRYCAPFSSGFSPQVAWSLDVTWSCRLLFLDQLHLHSDSFEYIYILRSFHEHGCLVDIGCCCALFLHAWVIAADNSDWHHSDLLTSKGLFTEDVFIFESKPDAWLRLLSSLNILSICFVFLE